MICKNCGKEIEENTKFCIFCGANQQAEPAAPAPVEEEQPKKKKGCLIAAIIAIVAVVLVGAILLVGIGAFVFVYLYNKPVQMMPGSSYEDIWQEDNYYEGDLDIWEEDGIHYEALPEVQYKEPVWNVSSPYRAVAEKYGMFIFPTSNCEYLSVDMLEGMTMEELNIAWAEICARHGFVFVDPYLDEYFHNTVWYTPMTDDFNELEFNEWEISNILLIDEYLASIA